VAHRVKISSIVLFFSLEEAGGAAPITESPSPGAVLVDPSGFAAGAAEAAAPVVAVLAAAAGVTVLSGLPNPPRPVVAAGAEVVASAGALVVVCAWVAGVFKAEANGLMAGAAAGAVDGAAVVICA
jgi:hypothetical protein